MGLLFVANIATECCFWSDSSSEDGRSAKVNNCTEREVQFRCSACYCWLGCWRRVCEGDVNGG